MKTEHKRDAIHLFILILVACVLGIYLIVSTVLISKDGVFYIERAQRLASDPVGLVKEEFSPGFEFLIFATHEFVTLFTDNSSLFTWIYSAQSVTLLCRLFGLISLYFIGKMLVGSKRSFYAMLILILLPYPAKMTSDVLREWPHILFLSTGFLLLLCGSRCCKWWMFGLAGLVSGIGHIIRPEAAQLVIFGGMWLLYRLIRPECDLRRTGVGLALVALVIGFAIPFAPYAKARGRIIPENLRLLISYLETAESETNPELKAESGYETYTASGVPGLIAGAIGRLAGEISENLMYYFLPALVVGVYARVHRRSAVSDIERFFMSAFVSFNIIILILLYYDWQYMARRHCLPLVAFTILYVPAGLEVLAQWLEVSLSKGRLWTNPNPQLCFAILFVTGAGLCIPKLLLPARADKQGYLHAAEWLKNNTNPEDVIAVTDGRMSFYAEREGVVYGYVERDGVVYENEVPERAKYVVRIVKGEDEKPEVSGPAREEFSVWLDGQEKTKKIVIWRVL